MSQAATKAPVPGQAAVPGGGEAPALKKGLRISISFKFAFFTVLLIAAVMVAVGYSLYAQQKQALSRQVLARGQAIAENLAASSREVLLADDLLNLSILTKKVVQQGSGAVQESRTDFRNTAHLVAGVEEAAASLWKDLPVLIDRTVQQVMGQEPAPAANADRGGSKIENEGILEAVIVAKDKEGEYKDVPVVKSHHAGTSEVGKPWKDPVVVQEATEETPFPLYEVESFVGGKRVTRRLFHIQQEIVEPATGKRMGSVHLGLDQDLIQRVVFGITMKLVVVALAALGIGLLVTLVLVYFLTRPIGQLVTGVTAIASGDFDTRVKASSRDELGALSRAFNNMAVSLSQNEMLKGAFTRYVSDAALKQILADPSKTGLHSKRTLATIFTSDVRGFTSMSETLEPEQVVQIINTYLSLQTEIILRHNGVVDKFIGDATIGVWGKEAPSPDDALNAVRAAWESQETIDKMNAEREKKGEVVKLIGIGVNTGEVVSGNMGSSKKMEYTVTGEHVIFADQICAECPGGKVWISESTYAAVKDQVIVEKAEMKAKAHGSGAGKTVYQVKGFR